MNLIQYGYILKTCSSIAENTVVFFLLGNYGALDKNLSHQSPILIKLIRGMGKVFSLGLHPSFASNNSIKQLILEASRFKKMLNKDVVNSRQHYLVFEMPKTYEQLIDIGVENEYSMGYPDTLGFRAGTCTPFRFYNLTKNTVSEMMIHPFCIMDVTLKNYLNLTIPESIKVIDNMIEKVDLVGGQFVSVWHNESMSDKREWLGWRFVYEKMLNNLNSKVNKN